jgi:L-alanine-DL-glutamate epimerase-like enolase superfamily enzyme
MKITDVRLTDTYYVPVRAQADSINTSARTGAYNFCQVFTDEGVTGMGFSRASGLNKMFIEESLKPYIVGEDPMNNERIWSKMYWALLGNGRRGQAINAISQVDIAIWDLKGKITGQPIQKLLGGYRDSVPAYGSGINLNLSNDELVKEMSDFIKAGFKAVKMKIGQKDTKADMERVRLVRQAIGPDADLCLDVNNSWSINTAIEMAKRLEEYDIYWLEEPILADEFANLARLARETKIPIAIGENHYTKWEFKELIQQGAVGVVQADLGKCGGVTEMLKIAAMADAYGLPMAPHFTEFTDVPVIASLPNGLICEYVQVMSEALSQLFINPFKPMNGYITPLNKSGFGLEVNPDVAKKFSVRPAPEMMRRTTVRGWRWPPYA